jgi:hypothetical protein
VHGIRSVLHFREEMAMAAYEDESVRVALKRYRRKKSLRQWVLIAAWIFGVFVPSWEGFSRPETFIWFVGLLCFASFEFQRQHLRAMQIRLAEVLDTLNRVAGEDIDVPNDCLLGELSKA